jgi:hypothetical protein
VRNSIDAKPNLWFFITATFIFSIPLCVEAKEQKMNVAPNYSFENDLSNIQTNTCVFGGWFPIGVVTRDGGSEIKIVDNVARTGIKSLLIRPNINTVEGTIYYAQYNGGEEVRNNIRRRGVSGARTIAFRLDQDIDSCDASVWVKKTKGQEIALKAIWYTRRNRIPFIKIGEDQSDKPELEKGGWYKYSLHVGRKELARQVQIAIVTDGAESFYIDDVEVYFNRAANVKILVDQLGYEPKSEANHVMLQSSTEPQYSPASFSLINQDNDEKVFTGQWKEIGYNRQWDYYYWQGSFAGFDTPERYVIKTVIDHKTYASPSFEVRQNLLVPKTAELAYRFFYYQRCGTEVPGFHKACHLDDSVMPDGTYKDLAGGWHDAGDYNKYSGYTPESVYALACAYEHRKDFFDKYDRDGNDRADILDEAEWGAKFLKKCIDMDTGEFISTISSGYGYWGTPDKETDSIPKTGDERPVKQVSTDASACIPGFALLGKYLPEYLVIAEQLYEKHPGNMQTILALYNATGERKYCDAAEKRAVKLLADKNPSQFRELGEYAVAFPNDKLIAGIKSIAKLRLDELKTKCDNPFGITRRTDENGKLIYFRHYLDVNNWYVGESRELLDTAYEGILLDRLGFPEGRQIASNQVHWILGLNPYGVSMMEGIGSIFVPQYHHRYNTLPDNPRGAVPGAVINGITRAWPDHDRPWLDLYPQPNADYQANEPWLPHNNRWLFLVAIW